MTTDLHTESVSYGQLTDTDRAVLDAAGGTYLRAGQLERILVDLTGLPPFRAFQRLNALLEQPAAWEYAPHTCARLDRRRRPRGRAVTTAG